MLIASKNKVDIDKLKEKLLKGFETKDLGEAKKILDMEIQRVRVQGNMNMTQSSYLNKVL